VDQVADFIQSIDGKQAAQPDFRSAQETQKVCDAVLNSAKSGKWESV
jgi:predicted dehydrogenase